MRRVLLVVLIMALTPLSGCASGPSHRTSAALHAPTTQQESTRIISSDYDAAWEAIEKTLRSHGYSIAASDYRQGVITTEPLISKQFFEFWRNDTVSAGDVAESSLATVRRSVRFDIAESDDGTFEIVPRVSVERYALPERRITSTILYRGAFRRARPRTARFGGGGVSLSPYWYDIGSDPELERAMAEDVMRHLGAQ